MFQRSMLVCIILCFSVGLACLGITLVLARRRNGHLARAFLAFYAVFSILVMSGLLRAFADAFPRDVDPSTRLVQRGLSNKGLGEELHISPNTVKTHLRAVFETTDEPGQVQVMALPHDPTNRDGDWGGIGSPKKVH